MDPSEFRRVLVEDLVMLELLFVASWGILQFSSDQYYLIAPISLSIVYKTFADISISNEVYPVHEAVLPGLSLCYLFINLNPVAWKTNILVFALGMGYYGYLVHTVHHTLSVSFVL